MVAALRAIAFVISALGVELSRGVGVAALLAAAIPGYRRWGFAWIVPIAVAGTAAAGALPSAGPEGGKIAHGLSNAGFLALLYMLLSAFGFALGRLARRMRA